MLCGDSLSKHGDPVVLHLYPPKQNLARVRTRGLGGVDGFENMRVCMARPCSVNAKIWIFFVFHLLMWSTADLGWGGVLMYILLEIRMKGALQGAVCCKLQGHSWQTYGLGQMDVGLGQKDPVSGTQRPVSGV